MGKNGWCLNRQQKDQDVFALSLPIMHLGSLDALTAFPTPLPFKQTKKFLSKTSQWVFFNYNERSASGFRKEEADGCVQSVFRYLRINFFKIHFWFCPPIFFFYESSRLVPSCFSRVILE